MSSNEAIRETLRRACVELNPTGDWPIDLKQIMFRLGLELNRENSHAKKGKAYLRIGNTPSIVLICRDGNGPLCPSERFSIAHELAHWVIWCRHGIVPSGRRDYWLQERLCNDFAAQLLVSRPTLVTFLDDLQEENMDAVYFPQRVANAAGVSWSVAARSISEVFPASHAYLRLVKEISQTTGSQNEKVLRVKCSSLSTAKGIFVGQKSLIRNVVLSTALEGLEVGSIIRRRVSAQIGQLHLIDTPCTFYRESSGWTAYFCPNHQGVNIECGDLEHKATVLSPVSDAPLNFAISLGRD